MQPERVAKLRQEYTDKLVAVDPTRPELARFAGMIGRVRTVNFNGRALVEFDGAGNRGWHDVELDFLKVVDPPGADEPSDSEESAVRAAVKLSPLELARMAKQEEQKSLEPASSEPPAGHGGADPASAH